MDRNTETVFFFNIASELATARRAGNKSRLAEAIDEMEVFAMYAESPKLAQRAAAALAA
jgi:hypothetical protein